MKPDLFPNGVRLELQQRRSFLTVSQTGGTDGSKDCEGRGSPVRKCCTVGEFRLHSTMISFQLKSSHCDPNNIFPMSHSIHLGTVTSGTNGIAYSEDRDMINASALDTAFPPAPSFFVDFLHFLHFLRSFLEVTKFEKVLPKLEEDFLTFCLATQRRPGNPFAALTGRIAAKSSWPDCCPSDRCHRLARCSGARSPASKDLRGTNHGSLEAQCKELVFQRQKT